MGSILGMGVLLKPMIGSSSSYFGVGVLFEFLGAVLMIQGREVFGKRHRRNLILSLKLFLGGVVGGAMLGAMFTVALNTAAIGNAPASPEMVTQLVTGILMGGLVGGAVAGIAQVLFTYSLQRTLGRILLFTAYSSNLIISMFLLSLTLNGIAAVADRSVATGRYNFGKYNPAQVQAFLAKPQPLQILVLIPLVLYTVAFYMAWLRINRSDASTATSSVPDPFASEGTLGTREK